MGDVQARPSYSTPGIVRPVPEGGVISRVLDAVVVPPTYAESSQSSARAVDGTASVEKTIAATTAPQRRRIVTVKPSPRVVDRRRLNRRGGTRLGWPASS